jgi:hypothetical protein
MKTATPPVSDAVLTGTWSARFKVTSTVNFTYSTPKTWSETWKFTPACSSGPCNVKLYSNGAAEEEDAFAVPLTGAGTLYTGSASVNGFASCKSSNTNTPTTVHIRIKVQEAGVTGKTWVATSWDGTAIWDVQSTKQCSGGTVYADISSP